MDYSKLTELIETALNEIKEKYGTLWNINIIRYLEIIPPKLENSWKFSSAIPTRVKHTGKKD